MRRQALLALANGLVDQQRLGNRRELGIDDMQLHVGILLLHLFSNNMGDIVAAGKSGGKAQIDGGNATLRRLREGLGKRGNGDLRGGRTLAMAHTFVEIMGRHALAKIVKVFLVAEKKRELDEIDPLPIDDRKGKIAARVDNQIAFIWLLLGHGPFVYPEKIARCQSAEAEQGGNNNSASLRRRDAENEATGIQ